MNSKLLSRFDASRSEEFPKDIAVLVELPDEALEDLPRRIASIAVTRSSREDDQLRDEAANTLGIQRARLDHAIDIGQFFLKEFLSSGRGFQDDPVAIAADLAEAELIPEDREKVLRNCLLRMQSLASDEVERLVLKASYGLTGLPAVESIGTFVDFRAVFDESFRVGYSVEEYEPSCLGTVPVVIVHLGLDEGPVKDVHFHADLRTVRLLIDHMQSAEKQIGIAQAYLGLEEDAEGKQRVTWQARNKVEEDPES